MRRTRVLAVASVVALLAVAALGYVELSRSPGDGARGGVTVSDVCDGALPASFRYDGNGSGFLSDSYGAVPTACATETVAAGSTLSLTLVVHSSDLREAHELTQVTVPPPYVLVSLTPGVPQLVSRGGNVSFDVGVGLLSSPGTYDAPAATVTVD